MPRKQMKTVVDSARVERAEQLKTSLHQDILQSQQTDANGELADTKLICNGGCIRVHGFLLQAASPFIRNAMASQGEDYPHVRKILLPDFQVKEIETMLSLIYRGYAELSSIQEVESLKELLEFFQVKGVVDFNLDEDDNGNDFSVKGGLKVQMLNRIPQDIFKIDNGPGPSSLMKSQMTETITKPRVAVTIKNPKEDSQPKLGRVPAAPPVKLPSSKANVSKTSAAPRSTYVSKANAVSTSTNGSNTNTAPANVSKTNTAPANVSKINTAPANVSKTNTAPANVSKTNTAPANVSKTNAASTNGSKSNTAPANVSKTNTAPANVSKTNTAPANVSKANTAPPIVSKTKAASANIFKTKTASTNLRAKRSNSVKTGNNTFTNTVKDSKSKKVGDSSGTGSEDEDWVQPNFEDKAWFDKESKRCQSCKKTYGIPAQAAQCITSHNTLHCYFCFKIYSSTDTLFKHFGKRHKQAGRESTLIFPYCDVAVPYKSVSCHVISHHLTPSKSKPGPSPASLASGSRRRRRSRSRSVSTDRVVSSDERHSQKKLKRGQNRNPDSSSSAGKKVKKPQLKLSERFRRLRKKVLTEKKEGGKKLVVRNLDVTLEKKTVLGKTLVIRIQKIHSETSNGDNNGTGTSL